MEPTFHISVKPSSKDNQVGKKRSRRGLPSYQFQLHWSRPYLEVVDRVGENGEHAEVVVHHHVGDVTVDEDLSRAETLLREESKKIGGNVKL